MVAALAGVGVGVGSATCVLEADGEGLGDGEWLSSRLGDGPILAARLEVAVGPTVSRAWVDDALAGADCAGAAEDGGGVLTGLLAEDAGTEIDGAGDDGSVSGDACLVVEVEGEQAATASSTPMASEPLARPVPVRRGMPHADTPTGPPPFTSGAAGRSVTRRA
jgi:hypothetical protein